MCVCVCVCVHVCMCVHVCVCVCKCCSSKNGKGSDWWVIMCVQRINLWDSAIATQTSSEGSMSCTKDQLYEKSTRT